MKYYFADSDKRKIKKELKIILIKSDKNKIEEEEKKNKIINSNVKGIKEESISIKCKTDNSGKKKLVKENNKEINELTNNLKDENIILLKKEEKLEKRDINDIKLLNDLTKDSYSDYILDNTFTLFKSIDDIIYLIYSNINKSIISYDILKYKKTMEIKNAHKRDITNFRHFLDKVNKRDLMISISLSDNNLKLWNISNFECLINLENINKSGRLFSACLMSENNAIYIITSCAYGNNESIKIFNMESNKIKELNDSTENVYYIDTYYDNILLKNYVIVGNNNWIKSYDYNNNKIYNKYNDNSHNRHCSLIINSNDDKIKLIDSCFDGNIRIWDFHSGKLLNKIRVCDSWIIGICLWDNDYLCVGCGDKSMKIINLKKNLIDANLKCFKNKVLCIKKLNHPQLGECLISQGYEKEQIKLFAINNLYEI